MRRPAPHPVLRTRRRLLQAALGATAALAMAGRAAASNAAAGTAGVAVPPEVAAEVPGAQLQGSGLLRFLGLRVYDARLWTAKAVDGSSWVNAPLALELIYARKLVGRLIAERSLEEMRRQGEIPAEAGARWLADMTRMFPDVAQGDRITGVLRPGQGSRFFVNGRAVGDVADAEFSRLFFGIWLSARTSEPGLRDALLGRSR